MKGHLTTIKDKHIFIIGEITEQKINKFINVVCEIRLFSKELRERLLKDKETRDELKELFMSEQLNMDKLENGIYLFRNDENTFAMTIPAARAKKELIIIE